jgi:hypothetical protein
VVLISHGLWQRRYAGDPNIIGREIDLGGKTTVIGIMPPGFQFPISDDKQDFWEPIFSAQFMTKGLLEQRDNRFLPVFGRLKQARQSNRQKPIWIFFHDKSKVDHLVQTPTSSSMRCRCMKTSRATIAPHCS